MTMHMPSPTDCMALQSTEPSAEQTFETVESTTVEPITAEATTIDHLLESFGVRFKTPALLLRAVTHKSFSPSPQEHNEKLEFLGDAVLDLALADALMRQFPDNDEGRLSKKRASLVNEKELATVAQGIGLQRFLRLGKSELQSQGALKPRLLSSSLEALVGAVYLDQGFLAAQLLVQGLFAKSLRREDAEQDYSSDYKTRFQEAVQARDRLTPIYRVVGEEGPPHSRSFRVQVETEGRVWAQAEGASKKAAEQRAARAALDLLEKEKEDKK